MHLIDVNSKFQTKFAVDCRNFKSIGGAEDEI